MKKITTTVLSLSLISFLFSCGGTENKAQEETTEETAIEEVVEVKTVSINPDQSKVTWEGSVLGMYSHSGDVNVVEGMLNIEGNKVIDGSFVVDLKSMQPTDENYNPEDGKSKEKLVEHLSSAEFFFVDSFPLANFEIISHNLDNNTIVGNLTVRGNTKEEIVEDVKIDLESGVATGKLVFNRNDYEVAFKHPAKDVVISDDIKLAITLKM